MSEEQFNDCICRMKNGDRSGLKDVYEAYLSYIYRIVLGVVGRKEDAEDITTDFFIKLYTKADSYIPGTGHKGYMATIARNMAIDFLRKNKREVLDSFTQGDDEEVYTPEPSASDDTEAEVIENVSLQDALNHLNPKERVIVDMKILSEMTFQEISDSLKIPMGTVTWRYREAMKKLRRCGYYEESSN